jgi:hypothetical protein
MKLKARLSRIFTLKKVKAVYETGTEVREEVKEIHHERKGDDYYVRYDTIATTSPTDKLTAEVAFVGSMIN